MGQKVHPLGFRIGITEHWRSRWYAPKAAYGEFLVEDYKIRRHIDKRLNRQPPYAAVSRVEIERTRNDVKLFLHTARPGLVIGLRGAEVEKLREELEELIDRKVAIDIVEIRSPDTDAQLIAEAIAEQFKKRSSFRRVIKQRAETAMSTGLKGVKIQCKGRLGGAEMARKETQLMGSIPLHTLQAHIDYGFAMSRTKTGAVGIKVWLYKGRYGEEVELTAGRSEGRRGGGGGGGRDQRRRGKRA
ncbi:MAG: 30S ribosomal protein S3 [Planctomycetes bacterium]|nr:30S ribosomal protein S3 [Planctomycetota bacterium]